MDFTNIKQKNEAIALIAKAVASPTVKVYKIVLTTVAPIQYTLVDISATCSLSIVNILEDYYKLMLTTPNVDCHLYVQIDDKATILRIGSPENMVFHVDPTYTIELVIPYRHIANDGTVITEADLTELGFGLYFKKITTNINNSFVNILDTLYPLKDYPITVNQSTSFDMTVQIIEM